MTDLSIHFDRAPDFPDLRKQQRHDLTETVGDAGLAAHPPEDICRSDPGRISVATGFSGGELLLGLDRLFEVRGLIHLGSDELVGDLPFVWQADVIDAVGQVCSQASCSTSRAFTIPPMLLLGESGVGRTHLARGIASQAGLPYAKFDLRDLRCSLCDPRRIGPDLKMPAPPVLVIAASGCANPVISIEGVDEAGHEAQEWLAGMLDPIRSARWIDQAVGAVVDLNMISWFVQSCDLGGLAPMLLNALHIVEMREPLGDDVDLHIANVLIEAARDLGLLQSIAPWVVPEALEAMRGVSRDPFRNAHCGDGQSGNELGYTAALYQTAVECLTGFNDATQ